MNSVTTLRSAGYNPNFPALFSPRPRGIPKEYATQS
jgi:hypothetical protein